MKSKSDITFYYYHNPSRNPHITIHLGSCNNCNYGRGMHINVQRGLNSVWSGPFDKLEWAVEYIENNIKKNFPITYCSNCKPQDSISI